MKVIFLGPAYPYRGGIATIIETLARVFAARGWEVGVWTFRVQYPSWLFPGRSQFRDGTKPQDIDIQRVINTINPLNWLSVGLKIARRKPDMVVLKYWTPMMAPCFGTIARVAKIFSKHTKFIVQLDNVVPHERHWWDGLLTRFFVRSMDGFVAMSRAVARDLEAFRRADQPCVTSPHPLFDNFGERVARQEACRLLGLDPAQHYAMFFGLVREYKGLDLLLSAWKPSGERMLLVVGEFYDDIGLYDLPKEGVVVHPHFVPDEQVRLWFSVADLVVLPYRSATQSGVTQIAYHFGVPMVVTDVGGLPEVVRDGTVGYVVPPTAEGLVAGIERAFENLDTLRANFATERQRFGWDAAADAILAAAHYK